MSVSRFEIELDRPNGVYYTGEVLRGKVKLTTVGTVKTRGVRIRFRGESYVHWHTGSGDNRNDYYGNKIYEEHRYTIFGNYFNTAIIDNAGANAYFGSAGGDGIMYVPCNSDEHLRLIVRVMDYDFGKKDDICGEIVLDVSELAASGRAQSFPLRRKGNAEKGEVTLSARILPFDAIMSQSSMNANNYNSVCQLQAHQATGLRSANFIGKNDVYVQAYRLPDRGVNESKALPNPITDVKIPEGTMEFPFAFIIRADAPGSAEFHHGDDCYLRYSLYANIDKKWWLDPSVRRAITVLPSRPVPSAMLLRPVVHRGEQQEIASCYCCFWCTKAGKVVANMKLPKRSFVVGELLPVEVEVVNKSTSSVMAIELSLRRLVRMSTTGTYSAICYYDFYTPIVSSTVKPLGTYSFSNLNFHVPNNYPSFFGASGMAPNKKDPLTFAYSVLLVVKTPSMCSSTSQVEIPILLSAVPCAQDIDDTPIEQIEAKADPFSIAPLVSNEIAVRPEGHISPASITINNIGNPDEDRSAVQSYSFQPYVVVYDNPTAEYGTASNAPIASANATPIHGLLEAMRGSSDKATVVSRWLAANPSAKSSVTPNDVTKIFQEVTFSLEQSSVALELSRQLGKSHLQCAHVVAACNSCSFFKADVAQVMAPYVSDIENKESILSMFASYDREKVEKALNH